MRIFVLGFEAAPTGQEDIIEGVFVIGEALQLKVVLLNADRHDVVFLLEDVLAGDDEIASLLLISDNGLPVLFEFGEGAFESLWRHAFRLPQEETKLQDARKAVILAELGWPRELICVSTELLVQIPELLRLGKTHASDPSSLGLELLDVEESTLVGKLVLALNLYVPLRKLLQLCIFVENFFDAIFKRDHLGAFLLPHLGSQHLGEPERLQHRLKRQTLVSYVCGVMAGAKVGMGADLPQCCRMGPFFGYFVFNYNSGN